MCIRDRLILAGVAVDAVMDSVSVITTYKEKLGELGIIFCSCLLYTSDAADERSSVDLGGRRIVKKKKKKTIGSKLRL
mgnify:CR=1 FL=1